MELPCVRYVVFGDYFFPMAGPVVKPDQMSEYVRS